MSTIALEFKDHSDSSHPHKTIAHLRLNRPEAANAIHAEMMDELAAALELVQKRAEQGSCRLLVFSAEGRHFSAGADLAWMKASQKLSYEDNLAEARRLSLVYERLAGLSIPSLALAQGAVYGGACGLIAACDYAFAAEGSRFCLSEVRLGLLPAVILPYLKNKMREGDLLRWALSAQVFTAEQAKSSGLIQDYASPSSLESLVQTELEALLKGGPQAQLRFKSLMKSLQTGNLAAASLSLEDPSRSVRELCFHTIAEVRTQAEAQEGLSSFFAKRLPTWTL
ncbi:MAG: enoyl-CoA hydratase/isomerase family protein [Oligoflexales bacterium]|nr:enoyl-CoA hydratase/isomerase family protein [Oligoflexales bacterium]